MLQIYIRCYRRRRQVDRYMQSRCGLLDAQHEAHSMKHTAMSRTLLCACAGVLVCATSPGLVAAGSNCLSLCSRYDRLSTAADRLRHAAAQQRRQSSIDTNTSFQDRDITRKRESTGYAQGQWHNIAIHAFAHPFVPTA